MQIDEQVVNQVAKLANLKLTTDEVGYYKNQLTKILTYVGQLSEIKDVSSQPANDATGKDAYWEREDVAQASLNPEVAMANAPRQTGSSFQVPRIIE